MCSLQNADENSITTWNSVAFSIRHVAMCELCSLQSSVNFAYTSYRASNHHVGVLQHEEDKLIWHLVVLGILC